MKTKMVDRVKVRKEVREWMGKRKLSYQTFTQGVNAKSNNQDDPPMKYGTAVSYGTRGHIPRGATASAIQAAYPDFPLLKYR